MAKKSQIKFPLHLVKDAQGPCGIMDATGRAVAWFSDVFTPTNGFVWEPEKTKSPDPDARGGATYWKQRNDLIRKMFEALNNNK